MPVLGIGGLFFRTNDPDMMSAWYHEHLGVGAGYVVTGGDTPHKWSWVTKGGPVVFAPFEADTDYLPAGKQFMMNLRVDGLDALIADLEAAGIEVITSAEWDDRGAGRFARIHDPEGNAVELWEPPASAPTG